MKILTVIGTRPEAIKLAPVLDEFREYPSLIESKVCVTHQHRELLDPMLELFNIRSDYDLDIMRAGQSSIDVARAVLKGLDEVLSAEKPDWVMIQGDTTTVMAASLAAFYHKTCVAHVEAGMRTFDKYSPFPEEINRRMAGVVADLHFAPTRWAANNLKREGVPDQRIVVTGNPVIDSLQRVADMPFDPAGTPLEGIPLDQNRTVVITAHRNENFGEGMDRICEGLRALAERHKDLHLVYPVHPNPQAREPAYRHLSGLDNVSLLPPLEYQPFVWLLKRSQFLITDSGGLQEEAAGLGKPVLVLRETTERPEGIDAGIAKLIGTSRDELLVSAGRLLRDPMEYNAMANAQCPYGDGTAAQQIVDALLWRTAGEHRNDQIYEEPTPQHPLDALLRHAATELPSERARDVITRFGRRASDRQPV